MEIGKEKSHQPNFSFSERGNVSKLTDWVWIEFFFEKARPSKQSISKLCVSINKNDSEDV